MKTEFIEYELTFKAQIVSEINFDSYVNNLILKALEKSLKKVGVHDVLVSHNVTLSITSLKGDK